jgi:hypothetical protein
MDNEMKRYRIDQNLLRHIYNLTSLNVYLFYNMDDNSQEILRKVNPKSFDCHGY